MLSEFSFTEKLVKPDVEVSRYQDYVAPDVDQVDVLLVSDSRGQCSDLDPDLVRKRKSQPGRIGSRISMNEKIERIKVRYGIRPI